MCVVCGCADSGVAIEAGPRVAENGDLHFGAGSARVSVPGMSAERAIKLETDVLGANQRIATRNRRHFAAHGVHAYNLVSSPGSGKTTLLCATGAPAIQVNTGKGCHLDAPMVAAAFDRLPLHGPSGLLFIENVGNLVCPALWDLGERAKVAILSVTEGEDKPLKYPDMFAAAHLMLLNKTDLLPYLDFDVDKCIAYARRVNPSIEVIQLSARSGEGMAAWLDWLLVDLA